MTLYAKYQYMFAKYCDDNGYNHTKSDNRAIVLLRFYTIPSS